MDSLSAAVNNMSIQGSPRSPLAAADDDVQVTPPPANEAERRAAQLVFFDLETTVPATDVIEFGAIVVDRHAFYEIETYQSLVFSDKIDDRSIAANGITPEMLEGAPQFEKIADRVYDIMHGRIWVGHNILAFDNVQLRAAFERIKKPAPEPAGLVDTLVLLRKQTDYVKRLGSLAMANLGAFYGLGEEKHRTIADCRMTIDVMKCIALNQFFEQHVPDLFPVKIVRQKKVKRRTDLWKKTSSAAASSADDSKDGDPNTTPAARRSNRRAPKTPQVDVPSVPVPADGFDAAAAGGWGDDVPEDPALVALIDHALANQIPMYMCYGGSSNPLSVKRVLVQSWGDRPKTFRAFVEGSANDNAIYFATRRVVKLHEQPFTMQS